MLESSTISFPGLGIGEFSVDSVAFSIGDFSIAWYALIITFGMIMAGIYIAFRGKRIGLSLEDCLDFILWAIPIGIVGARLYYVAMKPDNFNSIGEVLDIRSGGLAIYGGIIAGAIAVVVVSYCKKVNFFAFADVCTPGIILAQAIGRWGNFMNGEAYGRITDSFIRMGLQNRNTFNDFSTLSMVYVHPTFLYESLWNLVGFILINIFYKHKKYDGQIFLMVFGWYGLGRMWIEGLRTDSLYLFGSSIRVSQLLAAIIFTVCAVALIYLQIKKPTKSFYFKEKKTEEAVKNKKK
jgi:phosphatidylglycerol:prolipoprotein diacylglycerol transferase